MEFKQIYTPGLAHCSYVIGGTTAWTNLGHATVTEGDQSCEMPVR